MITYTENSMAVTEDGWYLVRVDGDGLEVAEWFDTGTWLQTGSDYDMWGDSSTNWTLQVICKLDLDAIAAGANKA